MSSFVDLREGIKMILVDMADYQKGVCSQQIYLTILITSLKYVTFVMSVTFMMPVTCKMSVTFMMSVT